MTRWWLNNAIGVLITTLVLGLCFALFAIRLATRSHPTPFAETTCDVRDSVQLWRNSFGIPHITAKSVPDMLFAQGYAHAQDRLWQMDVWRRAGRGRLAEVLGPRLVQADLFMRALDIPKIAAENIRSAPAATKAALTAYSNGVNKYIEDNRSELAFEFDALEYSPEAWTPEDCLIVGRVLAFEVSLAFWSDIAFTQIAIQRGEAAYREYLPRDASGPFVLDTTSAVIRDTAFVPVQDQSNAIGQHLNGMVNTLRDVRSALGMAGSGIGSNCWASRTQDGSSVLANDPHLTVSMPPKWYQIHLSCPEMNVVGMSLPGIPFILSGRNDHLAWGFTNAMIDDVDYVEERVDDSNPNYYFETDGRRTKFRYRRDTIRIKDQPDSLVDFRYTSRSCVISDVHMLRNPTFLFGFSRTSSAPYLRKSCITMRWTARYRSDEIGCLQKVCSSRNIQQFSDALRTWGSPCLTFSVSTLDGQLASLVAGSLPVRGSTDPNRMIQPWEAGADWSGVRPARDLGMMVNPRRNWIASANNRLTSAKDYSLGVLYEPSSRAQRIGELLAIYRSPTVRDVQVMQQDVVSPYMKMFISRLIPRLKAGVSRYGTQERKALATLERWDGTQSSLDPSASIAAVLLQRMLWNVFEDELGQQLFFDWTYVSSLPLKRLDELINEPNHILWDDTRTKQRETLDWIAVRSFIETVAELRDRFGTEADSVWNYGTLHTITFPHIFGHNELMRKVMDQGPFEIGGSQTTLNNSEWGIANPYHTRVAASMRVISHLKDTIQYSVVPGGSSGQPLSPHYADQLQLWLKGGYVRLPVKAQPHVSFRLYHVFLP